MGVILCAACAQSAERLDIVLKGGRVVDGSGAAWYVADVGIRDGKIVRSGRIEEQANRTIDTTGLVIAPGFIDLMGQTADPLQPELDASGKAQETWYALGWSVRPVGDRLTKWHTGSLPGTSTILIRRYDGRNIAVLFNARVIPSVDHLSVALEAPLHEALDAITTWPAGDVGEEQE